MSRRGGSSEFVGREGRPWWIWGRSRGKPFFRGEFKAKRNAGEEEWTVNTIGHVKISGHTINYEQLSLETEFISTPD